MDLVSFGAAFSNIVEKHGIETGILFLLCILIMFACAILAKVFKFKQSDLAVSELEECKKDRKELREDVNILKGITEGLQASVKAQDDHIKLLIKKLP